MKRGVYKYLKNDRFHNGYRLKEIETNEELTDLEEIHFIEIPKLDDGADEKDMLVNWIEFLKDPESETVRSLEMNIEEIRQAKDELIRMSNDDTQREIYEMRAKTLRDKISALNEAERKGRRHDRFCRKPHEIIIVHHGRRGRRGRAECRHHDD